MADAEKVYQAIAANEMSEPRLRAYALCDWGEVLSRYERLVQPGGIEKAISVLEQSLSLVPLDSHFAYSFVYLARVQGYQFRWNEQMRLFSKAKEFFEQRRDRYGLAYVYIEVKKGVGSRGLWKELFNIQKQLDELCELIPEHAALKNVVLWRWTWGEALAGRLSRSEQKLRESIALSRSLDDPFSLLSALRDLGWTLGFQGRYGEANQRFKESLEIVERLGADYIQDTGTGLGFWGAILIRQGEFALASEYLLQGLRIKEQLQDIRGIMEQLVWLGRLFEAQQDLDKAQEYYNRSLELTECRRVYFESESLTSLVRVRHARGEIPLLLAEAEALAQEYEYNDHLASLRLTQGHVDWTSAPSTADNKERADFESALRYYQQALIYALRYNRFLLDEVLWGHNVVTPLRSIIPCCLERGDEGQRMLVALRDWWQTGLNDIGASRSDTISPIPEGISLPEAELLARKQETGDGSAQRTVMEQIDAALKTASVS